MYFIAILFWVLSFTNCQDSPKPKTSSCSDSKMEPSAVLNNCMKDLSLDTLLGFNLELNPLSQEDFLHFKCNSLHVFSGFVKANRHTRAKSFPFLEFEVNAISCEDKPWDSVSNRTNLYVFLNVSWLNYIQAKVNAGYEPMPSDSWHVWRAKNNRGQVFTLPQNTMCVNVFNSLLKNNDLFRSTDKLLYLDTIWRLATAPNLNKRMTTAFYNPPKVGLSTFYLQLGSLIRLDIDKLNQEESAPTIRLFMHSLKNYALDTAVSELSQMSGFIFQEYAQQEHPLNRLAEMNLSLLDSYLRENQPDFLYLETGLKGYEGWSLPRASWDYYVQFHGAAFTFLALHLEGKGTGQALQIKQIDLICLPYFLERYPYGFNPY